MDILSSSVFESLVRATCLSCESRQCKYTSIHPLEISWLTISTSKAEKLINAFMTWRLDLICALLGGCVAGSINKLQLVQNAARGLSASQMNLTHYNEVICIYSNVYLFFHFLSEFIWRLLSDLWWVERGVDLTSLNRDAPVWPSLQQTLTSWG